MESLQDKRKKIIGEIMEKVKRPVILITYVDKEYAEISRDEVEFVRRALEEIDENEGFVILNGSGGEIDPTLEIAAFLRQRFINHMTTLIPKTAGSSFAYIALISNKLSVCNNSPLTQFDFTFIKDGITYRAPKDMEHNDPDVRADAKFLYNISIDLLEKILEQDYSLLKGSLSSDYVERRNFLIKVADACMRKGTHRDPITPHTLEKLGFSINKVDESDEVVALSQTLLGLAEEELKRENKRVCIEINDYTVLV